MSQKECYKARADVINALEDFSDKYEMECERLTEAIEAAYREGFEDARSDADNEVDQCWRASYAKKEADE
jgi:hypothetical protein